MNSLVTAPATRLVLVGGGPRAIAVLERLGAKARTSAQAAALQDAPLHVDIVDPHMPGSGRIWRADESPLLLMNSRAADVSIFTDDTVTCEGPIEAGPSLAEWAEGIRRGEIAAPTAGTSRLAEIQSLQPTDFASRRVQALYLEWFFGRVLAALPETVTVTVHRTTATEVAALAGAGASTAVSAAGVRAAAAAVGVSSADGGRGWRVELEGRAPLHADLLLLAAGHADSRPTGNLHQLAAFARRHGSVYLPPSQASDAPVSQIAAGQDVIVRGMGLAFIDLMALLTEGRGGSFVPDPLPGEPGRLRYLPSGEEPRLWVGSRRGVPYHSKVRGEGEPAGPGNLVHVTAENLAAREDAEGRLDFCEDVVPLIAAEIARWVPETPAPGVGEEPLDWLDDPLSWLHGDAHPKVTRDAVVRHIEHDLRARTQGDTTSARALFQLLLRLHGVLVEQLPASRLRSAENGGSSERSGPGGRRGRPGPADGAYPRWWHSLFSFVDSGPPPHRLHQLLALERAGVVHFLGPRVAVTADETTGRFTARGAAGVQVSTDALVDAFLPRPSLAESTNPLLRQLVSGGVEAVGRESAASPGTLDVDARHRVIGPDGTVREGLWALGPWTSELPIGAFARPRTGAACHRQSDALARELLDAAAHVASGAGSDASARSAAGRFAAVQAEGLLDAGAEAVPPTGTTARTGSAAQAPRLGVLGPGRIGSALARAALRSGLEVQVAGRGISAAALPEARGSSVGTATGAGADPSAAVDPSPGRALAARLPGARAVGLPELVTGCDLVALTVPLHAALALDPATLRGAIVLDATNPWGEEDAAAVARARARLGDHEAELSTSELLAALLPQSQVVKTLNHIGYHDVEDHGREDGHPGRRAIAVAADDPRAAEAVSTLLQHLGFDAVLVGTLAEGRELEPGASLFGTWSTAEELAQLLRERLPVA